MTNTFRILWFEDDSTWFEMESKMIRRELKNTYSFQTEIKREYGAEYDSEELKRDNYFDLVLMDYKLAAGNTGEQIVNLIRGNSILTDVVLYSSQCQEMVDTLKEKNPLIDGVFFADRKGELFESKILDVIKKIVRRSEDIVNLRGFFLDNTSEFEIRIKELLKISWDKLPHFHDQLRELMVSVLENSLKDKQDTVSSIKDDPNVYNIANNETKRFIISISNRLTILKTIIKILVDNHMITVPTELDEINDFKAHYVKEINSYRNALSHRKYSETSIRVNDKEIIVDAELHQKLRERVNRYDSLLCYLEECITAL